jgi:hypothetical protein
MRDSSVVSFATSAGGLSRFMSVAQRNALRQRYATRDGGKAGAGKAPGSLASEASARWRSAVSAAKRAKACGEDDEALEEPDAAPAPGPLTTPVARGAYDGDTRSTRNRTAQRHQLPPPARAIITPEMVTQPGLMAQRGRTEMRDSLLEVSAPPEAPRRTRGARATKL